MADNFGVLIISSLIIIVAILTFRLKIYYIFDPNIDENSAPIIIWWTKFMPDGNRFIECNKFNCLITNNRSYIDNNNLRAFIFYGSRIENNDFPLPRQANISWAIFHEESPKNYAPFLFPEVQSLFNVSSTFSRYSDFPITLQYLNAFNLLTDTEFYVDLDKKNKLLNSIAPVLYIQSDCDTPIGRDYLVNELMNYIEIDSYGKCLNNKKFPRELQNTHSLDLYNKDYMKFIAKYKFIIAFENAICDDYITEKLWRPLIVGSIPIYYGSPTIEEWLPNNKSAILVKDFKDIKDLAQFINLVNNNDTLYNSFLNHKILNRTENDRLKNQYLFGEDNHIISEFECFVCKSLHNNKTFHPKYQNNIYDCQRPMPVGGNTWYQHWDIGKYQAKALKNLIEEGRKYSLAEFDTRWKDYLKNNIEFIKEKQNN